MYAENPKQHGSMAVLWQKKVDNTHYEIRTAGRTRRLYTNGICHSEYNPDKFFTGSIWDLLLLPAWFYAQTEIQRILVLGVGGGSVLLQLSRLLDPETILGVELDPVHLYLARRFFNTHRSNISLIEADACDWLRNYDDEPFDMIIDDLYTGDRDVPVRAVEVDREWSACLLRHLKKGGLLSINFGSRAELMASDLYNRKQNLRRFPSVFQLTSPMLDNYVGVFVGRDASSRMLRKHLMDNPVIERAISNRTIRYRIRQLV